MTRKEFSNGETNYGHWFINFMNSNPTEFHASKTFMSILEEHGFSYLPERGNWAELMSQAKTNRFYTQRNGSCVIAFIKGCNWKPGMGVGLVGAHTDAICLKVKPVSKKPVKEGFRQLGIAPYSASNLDLWHDRDLGIGGRIIVRSSNGGIESKLVRLDGPVGRIPTLAPHFGAAASVDYNNETQNVPIYALESSAVEPSPTAEEKKCPIIDKHDIGLLRAIASSAGVSVGDILQLELEMFDDHQATFGGLHKDFIFCPRLDDKLCGFAALNGLIKSHTPDDVINFVGLFDNEEIGSLTRQGAKNGGLFFAALKRLIDVDGGDEEKKFETLANSFFVSSDVTHAVNPNFLNAYLENHRPKLNVGPVIKIDKSMRTTSDAVSISIAEQIAQRAGVTLQYFHVRNDIPSGGTIGPMTSAATGIRAIDIGIPQLSMHSIRATTGSKDVDLGVKFYSAFFSEWSSVDKMMSF